MSGERDLGGELWAIGREAVNDVRQTMNEVFFSQSEHGMGMGTPMNPTSHEVTKEVAPESLYQSMVQEAASVQPQEPQQEMER
jgi:hypothetical protein